MDGLTDSTLIDEKRRHNLYIFFLLLIRFFYTKNISYISLIEIFPSSEKHSILSQIKYIYLKLTMTYQFYYKHTINN